MKSIHVIIFIWLAWAFIVIGFQALATAQISVQYPDRAQEWTEEFTGKGYQEGHVFLLEPFMNNQVAWDSEYYLAIAVGGYDDPRSPHLTPRGVSMSVDENLAAIFGVCATLTRAVGVTLVIPMAIIWLRKGEWMDLDLEWRRILHQGIPLRPLARGLLAISPIIAFFVWKFSHLGIAFDYIEANYFERGFLALGLAAFSTWSSAFRSIFTGSNPQYTAYYITEFIGFAIGMAACIATLKTRPELAWFSLANATLFAFNMWVA